ncbi:MAG: DNA-binding domain-containing protein [Pseudomonadota bacterium]
MHSLREMQSAFASAVLTADSECVEGLIVEDGLRPAERMRIYRNNARIAFCNALRAAYPVVAQLGGDAWFESAALGFQQAFPSRGGDLQYAGERFAQFLLPELAGSGYDWFVDVARFEWAYQEVLVAPASPILDPLSLAAIAPELLDELLLLPRTELRLVSAATPVLAIWRAHQPNAEPYGVQLDGVATHVLLLRRADHVELRELPADLACLLHGVLRGDALPQALARFNSEFPGGDAVTCLRQLLTLDVLSAFLVPH